MGLSYTQIARTLVDVAVRAGLLAGVWLVLVDADTQSPFLAALSLVAAVVASMALRWRGSERIRIKGLLRFIPFFLWSSLAGGFDVARRAVLPGQRFAPELIPLRLGLGEGTPPTVFVVGVMNLLPGTLCVELHGNDLVVHVVDREQANIDKIRDLERHAAALFGVSLTSGERDEGADGRSAEGQGR